MDNDTTVILPTRNEAKAIKKIIAGIRALPIKTEVLVVDGLSQDNTDKIAEKLGATVIYERQKGKGIAIRTALKEVKTPYVVMIDADNTYPVEAIPAMLRMFPIYDIVKGHRNWLMEGAMTKTHHFGNWALSWLATILYGKKTKDLCSGMWAMKMDKVKQFDLISNGFTLEADLYINTVRTRCKFAEVPIIYKKRIEGDKAKLTLTDGLKIGWFLIRMRFKFSRKVHT